jgi:ABC-type sugar transport system substrate-binding protein
MDAGIPVIVQGVYLYGEKVSYIGRQWEGPGGSDVVGQYMVDFAERENKELHILQVWGLRSVEIEQEKYQGFRKPIDQCSLCTVIETIDCEFSDELAASIVMDAFSVHPELNALYVHGGGGTGAIEGLRSIGRLLPPDDPKHVLTALNDCDTVTVEALDEGKLDAFGTHGPWDLADVAVQVMLHHVVLGQPVPQEINIPMIIVTADNIDTARVLGGPAAYPRMPTAQWDLWPVLDASEFGIQIPNK